MVDGLDLDGLLAEVESDPSAQSPSERAVVTDQEVASHRDPVIRGFDTNDRS